MQSHVQLGVSKSHPKARLLLKSLNKRRGRLVLAISALAVFFATAAVLQHWFVHAHLYRAITNELSLWAREVSKEVAYNDKWDLEGYRRASLTVPAWSVVTKDGLIIDIEGFVPGLFGQVEPPPDSIFIAPQTISTAVGEKWRVFGRKVSGGFVVVGISPPLNTPSEDTNLVANAARFGSTFEEATSTRSREIAFEVDYAVVSSQGDLKAAWGGIPLKLVHPPFPLPVDHLLGIPDKTSSTLAYFLPIRSNTGAEVGAVIIPRDMQFVHQTVKAQDSFNLWLVVATACFACAMALLLVIPEILSQTKAVTLEEALKVRESRFVEFKGSLYWDIKRNEYVEERKLDVLKSIAGFLNAKGGTLFIGVLEEADSISVRGLKEDLARVAGSTDRLQLMLRDLITTRIGSEFSPLIADGLEEKDGTPYWRIAVAESPEPAFVRWKPTNDQKEQKKFYVREGPRTNDLDNESTWHYIKNKWG